VGDIDGAPLKPKIGNTVGYGVVGTTDEISGDLSVGITVGYVGLAVNNCDG